MAGTNEFKLFAGPSTNTLTPTAWAAQTALLAAGFSPGLASSQQANTLFRQLSTVCSGVGQFISSQNVNALDNGDVTAFATAFSQALAASRASTPSRVNRIINGLFNINQRSFAGGALAAGAYGYDRWKAGSSGATYSVASGFATITAGSIQQVIEGSNVPEGGAYTLSWAGTAQGRVDGGAYASSPITVTGKVAGSNTTVEFGVGTVSQVQYEAGAINTAFEYRLVSVEVAACLRYYQHSGTGGPLKFIGYCSNGNAFESSVFLPVFMRAVPTVVLTDLGSFGFPASHSANDYGNCYISVSRISNSNQVPGWWYTAWTASAEL